MQKTNQLAQPKLALHRIEASAIPVPPLTEQRHIVSKVNELMALCDELESRLAHASDTRHAFLEATLQAALSQRER